MARKPFAVILCKFSDQPQEPRSPSFYRNYFTETGSGTGGAFDYWRDVSFGNLDLTGSKVFGWYTMNNHSLQDLVIPDAQNQTRFRADRRRPQYINLFRFEIKLDIPSGGTR